MADYADFEIIAELESPDANVRQIQVRFIAEIDGVGYLQDDIIMTYPLDIDTPNKLAIHIATINLSNWYEALKYVPEVITECPMCRSCPGCGQAIDSVSFVKQPDGSIKCLDCLRIFKWVEAVCSVPLQNGECMVCGFKAVI